MFNHYECLFLKRCEKVMQRTIGDYQLTIGSLMRDGEKVYVECVQHRILGCEHEIKAITEVYGLWGLTIEFFLSEELERRARAPRSG